MKKSYLHPRRIDPLLEELLAALAEKTWYEFKPLFVIVYEKLRDSGALHGGQEMMRLRAYDKLQNLVRVGGVERNGQRYRGIPSGLASVTERLSLAHCRILLPAARATTPQPSA